MSVVVLALVGAGVGLWRATGAPAQQPPMLQPVFDLLGPNDEPQSEPQPSQQEPEPQPQPTPAPGPVPPLPPGQPQPQPQPEPSPEQTPPPEQTPAPSPEPQQPPPQQEQPPPQQQPPPSSNGQSFRAAPMQPFPTVRIKGYLVRSGARITLLSVTAPARTRVSVTCRGRGCPVRRSSAVVSRGALRVRAFERTLRAGVRLTIRITSPGRVGKLTSIRIRRDRVPLRHDACLAPGGSRPMSCPA